MLISHPNSRDYWRAAAGELKKEVDANSDAGKALSGALDLLNGKGQNAGDVFKGLTGILKGGQSAASGFSSVVKGLGSALGIAAGPLALLTTGIGLAVCDQIVQLHGGTLSLENAEGGGTLVTVRLPINQ